MNYTLNIRGRLLELSEPIVMGILNATPDSFFADSRVQTEAEIVRRAHQIVDEGAAIIDIGACSTRPGSEPVGEEEEMARLRLALGVVRRELPEAVVSVDTFRPDVARMAVDELGADIINDVGVVGEASKLYNSADAKLGSFTHYDAKLGSFTHYDAKLGSFTHYDAKLGSFTHYEAMARLNVPYILMASEPTLRDTLLFFAEKVQLMHDLGQKDIILDPGFGFGKTVEQNYELLSQLECLQVMELPVLVGVSRKSMIWKTLDCRPEDALNGTTALHAVALMKGASILRVHDVRQAVECVTLLNKMRNEE
jgi:dihydropteroate synthase